MKKKCTWAAVAAVLVALAALTGPAHAAVISGELGILDVSGTNPATGAAWAEGDTYRLAFITSTNPSTKGADGEPMTDIADYNALVQGLADAAELGGTWKIIGSTEDANAIDNTATHWTDEAPGDPILLVDGSTIVANDFKDLWDGSVQHIIDITEEGNTKSHWPFTGTYTDGYKVIGVNNAGGPLGTKGEVSQGNGGSTTDWVWRQWTSDPWDTALPFYAMSDELTVTPEPATMSLLVLGGLAMLRRRRNA